MVVYTKLLVDHMDRVSVFSCAWEYEVRKLDIGKCGQYLFKYLYKYIFPSKGGNHGRYGTINCNYCLN